jgi:FMN phosphatase YigB (HAD superfamily)
VRIAVDIDSTLHHYWDQFSAIAKKRFGVDLDYETQLTWEISRLRPEQARACVAESHTAPHVLAAVPYPGAVETIRAWHEAGHFIHVTSHRTTEAQEATAAWLDQIGLRYDELYCSFDKVTRCIELDIDVLIDDSPQTLLRAVEAGMTAATLVYPWNRDLCEEEDIVCAPDWPTLAERLEPVLA